MQPAAEHAVLRAEVGRIIGRTCQLLATSPKAANAVQHDEAASDTNDTDLDSTQYHDISSNFRTRFDNQDLVVAVLALTKSGRLGNISHNEDPIELLVSTAASQEAVRQ